MKAVILCGGRGIRLNELTETVPKPMVLIKDKPILYHIMNIYSTFKFNEFILCLGYKGETIRDYFLKFMQNNSDLCLELSTNSIKMGNSSAVPDWKIHFIDTGLDTDTGGRVYKIRNFANGAFMLTYGDGVGNINIAELIKFHKKMGKIATMTAVHPVARFGVVEIENGIASYFYEKPQTTVSWINGGFFVLDKKVFDYCDNNCNFERDVLQRLAKQGQLACFKSEGYWRCMDTYRDFLQLNEDALKSQLPWLDFDDTKKRQD